MSNIISLLLIYLYGSSTSVSRVDGEAGNNNVLDSLNLEIVSLAAVAAGKGCL